MQFQLVVSGPSGAMGDKVEKELRGKFPGGVCKCADKK